MSATELPQTLDEIAGMSLIAALAVDEIRYIGQQGDHLSVVAKDLATLAARLPSSCTTLDSAHRHVDLMGWRELRSRHPMAAMYDNDFAGRGIRTPLVIKVGMMEMFSAPATSKPQGIERQEKGLTAVPGGEQQ